MHPIIVEELINERHASLKRELHPPPRASRNRRAGPVRHRVGWTLVEVGLRLATS